MYSTRSHPVRQGTTWSAAGWLGVEVMIQIVLCGLAASFAAALHQAGMISVGPAFTVLAASIAVAAAILLALAGWLSADGLAVRIAFAVVVYGTVFLLGKAVEPDSTANGLLVRDLMMIGVAVLFGLALRRVDVMERAWRTSALVSMAVVGAVIVGRIADPAPPALVQSAIDIGTWVVIAAIGLALVFRGIRGGQALLRPTGLALLTLTAAPALRSTQGLPAGAPSPIASAFELAGVTMLLVTAVFLVVRALRTGLHEQVESQSRLHAAEDAMACTAVRDHEMRNLVAGLSGAVNVLTDQQPAAGDVPRSGQLRTAARAELERLRRMLDGDQDVESALSPVAVGPLLSGLAALHSTQGAAIEVSVAKDAYVLMPPDCLAHIVTNLLVNCARHARGALVGLTAYRRGDRVVIEVTDDGPGLPPGRTAELLRPGMRGPSSTGTGLGLHVSAELVKRYHGAIRLVPGQDGGRGCTVVVELPAVAGSRPLERVIA